MRRRTIVFSTLLSCFLVPLLAPAQGLRGGIAARVPQGDTARIVTLPRLDGEAAGAHGFVATDPQGRFRFADGTAARFVGVTLEWGACTPDSAEAIRIAARLAKLGVNLVRVRYFENSYPWGAALSVLDPAADGLALHPERMRRFDWLAHQLRIHGIYLYLTLQSARAPTASDGFAGAADSALWLGAGLYQLYPQGRAALERHARLLLEHVNPFSGRAYRDEPAVAMIELMANGSVLALWRQGVTQHSDGSYSMSFSQARRLDTLFAGYLRARYGNDAGLAAAWRVVPPPGGFANVVREGSFEGDFEQYWTAAAYDGPSVTPILTQNDSVPDGQVALTLRVRNTRGTIGQVYLRHDVPLEYNTLYRLSFRARASNAAGRPVNIIGYETTEGAFAGLQSTVSVTSSWQRHEAVFLTPQVMHGPVAIYFFFGDVDGDLSIDDVQLRAVEPGGLLPGESLATATVARLQPSHPATLLLSTQRIEDQSEFMIGLDRDLFTALRTYVRDSIGARQPITGAGHYWASSLMDASAQSAMDFTTAAAQWDYVESIDSGIRIRNSSQLRAGYAGAVYAYSAYARERQPFVASFTQPFPNRYLAESMLLVPAYALHQGWDAILFDTWSDTRSFDTLAAIPEGKPADLAHNPVANALLPAVSQIFRAGLLAPAIGTIRLRHTRRQIAQIPRFFASWGIHATPSFLPAFSMAVNRIVQDSLDATEFTQVGDISFPQMLDGEATSDTRQIRWEYVEGVLSIDAPRLQAATGHLARSTGVSLDRLDVQILSGNETATVIWLPTDSARTLEDAGRSLLVVTSRTESTAMRWRDTADVLGWGSGPMLIEPVRARLHLSFDAPVGRLLVTPLDSIGRPTGDTLPIAADGTVLIDQAVTPTQWFEVVVDRGSGAADGKAASALALRTSGSTRDGRIELVIDLPAATADAQVDLYDALGRHVRSETMGTLDAGTHRRNVDITGLASGAYTATLRTPTSRASTRLIVVH